MPSWRQELKAVSLFVATLLLVVGGWFGLCLLALGYPLAVFVGWGPAAALSAGAAMLAFLGFFVVAVICEDGRVSRALDRGFDAHMRWVDHVSGYRRIAGFVPLRRRLQLRRHLAARWLRFRYRLPGVPQDRFLTRRRAERADREILELVYSLERARPSPPRDEDVAARWACSSYLLRERLYALQHRLGYLDVEADGEAAELYGYHVTLAGRDWAGLPDAPPAPRRVRPSALA